MKKLAISISLAIATLVGLAPTASASPTFPPTATISVSPAKFYPTVRDGYRDVATIRVTVSSPYDCLTHAEVSVSGGSFLRSYEISRAGCDPDIVDEIRFDGSGYAHGKHRVEVSVTDDVGGSITEATTVVIAKGTKTERRVFSKDGNDFATRSNSGNCNWGTQSGRGILSTCMDGNASVIYRASAPRGFEIDAVRTYSQNGVWSCKNDRFSKSISGRNVVATFSHRGGPWTISQCAIYGIEVRASKTVRI